MGPQSTYERVRAALGAVALVAIASMPAQSQGRVPAPPPRPAATAPMPPAPVVPSRPPVPTDDADLDPDHPPVLPAAPRARMHACGLEWQGMKRRGADRDQTWRQFATVCLQKD